MTLTDRCDTLFLAVAFMVLDGVWLGLLMKNFYRDQLAPIVRLADGGMGR